MNLYRFNLLSNFPNLQHFVSQRNEGVSPPPFHTLNLGFSTGDQAPNVLQNRQLLCKALEIAPESCIFPQQVHGNRVVQVTSAHTGMGAHDPHSALPECDALVTNVAGLMLCVQSADCVPILLFDPKKEVVAAIHAGWRGTVAKIAWHTTDTLQQLYGTQPANLIAGIGPSIGTCCYETGAEVVALVRDQIPESQSVLKLNQLTGKYHLDLWEANRQLLLSAGLRAENIEIAGICSSCRNDLYFSVRRDKTPTGRYVAGIMLGRQQKA